jgi:RNA polymerase sigma-70 factor, ECF subfamily
VISTDETLLEQLKRAPEHGAWRVFFGHYADPIRRYARKLGLRDADAEDVLQETMVVLMRTLPEFLYDPAKGRFRNFLLTIVHRQTLRAHRRHKREQQRNETYSKEQDAHHSPPDREALLAWKEAILEAALERTIQSDEDAPKTIAIFRDYVLHHHPAPEVATRYGVEPNNVYQIKHRYLSKVRAEAARLWRNSGAEGKIEE